MVVGSLVDSCLAYLSSSLPLASTWVDGELVVGSLVDSCLAYLSSSLPLAPTWVDDGMVYAPVLWFLSDSTITLSCTVFGMVFASFVQQVLFNVLCIMLDFAV